MIPQPPEFFALHSTDHRRDGEEQLCRLRRVDLDREPLARTRNVYDTRLVDGAGRLDVFDRHRIVTGMIPRFRNFCLTSAGSVR